VAGFLALAGARRMREASEALAIAALGAQGKGRDINNTIKKWQRGR
jgi:hypothetical protein